MCLYESECFARLREAVVDRVRFDCRNMRNKVTHAVFLVDHPYATRLVGFSKTFVYGEFGVLYQRAALRLGAVSRAFLSPRAQEPQPRKLIASRPRRW